MRCNKRFKRLRIIGLGKFRTYRPTKRHLDANWVFNIKYKSDRIVERYKARLVILGNRQIEGVDFTETFAPVAKMVTVCVFLAVIVAKQIELHQMDVHNAFCMVIFKRKRT